MSCARLTRAAIGVFALAGAGLASGCDTVSNTVGSLTGMEIARRADPGPLRGPDLPPGDSVSRPVTSVPLKSRPDDPGPAIVVRGRETPPVLGAVVAAAAGPTATGVTPGAGGKAGDITLNFAGADIRDVAAAVLGDMLKMNYVIDPEVSGPITFNVSRPLSRDDVLPTFEAILNSRGATMTQTNGIVRIMPLRKEASLNPTGGGGPVTAPAISAPAPRAGERSESFTLRFVGATDMQHLLEKVLPAGQTVVADDRRHMLLVQGGARELALAADTVRIFDIDQLSGMSMALVPLRNAQPSAITDELRNIFAATRREAEGDAIRFMAIDRLNAVMVLSRSNAYLDEARNWIGRLDRTRDLTERRVYVYNLQYSKAVQVGQKLQGLLSGLDIQFKAPTPSGGDGDKAEGGAAKPDGGKPAPPPPAPIPVAAVAGDPPGDGRGNNNRNGVRVEADETHNALLISANARDYELIRQVLAGIDVPPLQVLIEVTVAEVVLNDKLNYGVEYFINAGKTNTLLTTASSALGVVPSTPGFALSWLSGNFQPRAILDMLSEVTETKVISTPRLLVLSNQTARLQVGDVVPIITQSATSTVTNNPLILNNVTYKETGVVLEVTPRVNSGGFVTMDVNQSVSDVVNTTTSNIDSPTIRQRRLTSTISVKTGESILLGGLIQQSNNRSNSGIPVLNEIPGVGALFGTRNNGAGRTELIMLMTPHVVGNEAQARDITGRVASQFQAVLDSSGMIPPRVPQR